MRPKVLLMDDRLRRSDVQTRAKMQDFCSTSARQRRVGSVRHPSHRMSGALADRVVVFHVTSRAASKTIVPVDIPPPGDPVSPKPPRELLRRQLTS